MFARLSKIVLSLPFLIAAGLFGAYVVFGFFLVDPVAKQILPWIGETKLASQLTVQKVEFNPLTLEATVQGLKLAEKSGQPLAGFDRLYVNLDTSGLFRFAWRIRDIQLSGPHAEFLVRKGGKLNWADLIAKLNEDKSPPSKTLPRILIDHIKIDRGDIEYTDANRSTAPFKASLQPLGIELDGLSTLPEDSGQYKLAARLPEQGGTLMWDGDIWLNPVKSDGRIGLQGVSLPNLLRVIKTPRNFELPSGTLAAGLRYRFALVKDKPWLQINGANLIAQNLGLAPKGGGAPVFELKEARVDNASLDLVAQKVAVASVSLTGGKLSATRNVNGALNWQTLFAASAEPAPALEPAARSAAQPPSADKAAPWKLAVNQIRLDDWNAHFTDEGFATPLGLSVAGFGLTAALTGEVGATAAIEIGPLNAALGPIQLQSGSQPVAELQRVALVNAGLKLAEKQFVIDAVELNGIKTTIALNKNGTLNWTNILKKAPGAPVASTAATQAETIPPVDVKLARLGIDGIEVGIVDQSPNAPVRLDIQKGFFTLQDLSLVMNQAMPLKDLRLNMNRAVPLKAGFALKQGGRFDASGNVIPGKATGKLDLKLTGLSLKPFAPYVNQFARLILNDGVAATSGRLKFAQGKKGPSLDYDGGFAVNNLAINEEDTGDAFLGWQKLASDSLEFRLGPNSLHMTELVAVKPFAKVIIFEDKSLNIKRIQRDYKPEAAAPSSPDTTEAKESDQEETPAAKPKPVEAAPKVQEAAKQTEFPLTIERLRIEDANAEFADLSLPTKFGTRMHSLGGVITGLSTDPATTAQVELDGQVDEFGSARIRGSIQPFRATEFTDLTLNFHNLEMANLTPYSGKFAGRKIDSGRLSVDLEYKIKNRQLAGTNKFVINKLKLGERVDSKDAMHLPLDLAIALLEDSNGIIDLDLPVSGSLDDPQFSYGRIIWKAIINVLTKLVTAPFRALGHLLGISSEKLEAVVFDPGSSMLLPPEQEKLKTLSEALAKRPALALTLEPGYDPEVDRRALQELAMRREAVAVAGIKLAPGEAPGPVDVNNYKIQTWLEDRYAELAGKDEYRKLRASFQDKNAGIAARLMESETMERLARRFKTRDTGPISPFHTELLERLTQKTKIDDDALVKLAQARGQAMREALIKLGIDAGRVSIGAPGQQTAKGKLVPSKMSLGVSKATAAAPPPATAPSIPVPAVPMPAGAKP